MREPRVTRIGIIGGGQLGRMLALEIHRFGLHVAIYDPDPDCPAAAVGHETVCGDFDDAEAIAAFCLARDVTTYEFENAGADALLTAVERGAVVRPSPNVLAVCQDRAKEKGLFREQGFPCVEWALADSCESLRTAVEKVGLPCVAKTTRFGYDGKGQIRLASTNEVEHAWEALGCGAPLIVESWMSFDQEFSILVARGVNGETRVFPPTENRHLHHILDVSIAPAHLPESVIKEASEIAAKLALAIGLEGLLAIECFYSERNGLALNELAPRPHNSGHHTMESCVTSQFEQQLRGVCGLPLGATDLVQPAVMVNLLGELWQNGEPDWRPLLRVPGLALHLYGKHEARVGRKMGHFTVCADTRDGALKTAMQVRSALRAGASLE